MREFTGKQIEVLKLYLNGASSKEIAHVMGVTKSAIDSRILTLHSKLGTCCEIDTREKALRLGLVSLQDLQGVNT